MTGFLTGIPIELMRLSPIPWLIHTEPAASLGCTSSHKSLTASDIVPLSWRTYYWIYLGAVEAANSHWPATGMLSTLEDFAAQPSDGRDQIFCLFLQGFVS